MQPSMFNLRVPIAGREEVFLMNTLTDAQLVVSHDVASLLDRAVHGELNDLDAEQHRAVDVLRDNGFLVANRYADREALDLFFATIRGDRSELHITVLTTLQCNFACDYCFRATTATTTSSPTNVDGNRAAGIVGSSANWIACSPALVVMFFGGEPLLNLR
jgi:uncharacterized protein